MNKINTKKLVIAAMLLAMEIILSRFLSISAWNMKIGFGFVPIVVAAMLLGPVYSAIVAALGDFLGAILFPIGAYFPGFTLTAFLTGVLFGVALYKKQEIKFIVASVILHQVLLSLFLNTFWISILYGSPYGPLFVTRLVQTFIMAIVEMVTIYALSKAMDRIKLESRV